jgi:hypothetical protein
MAKNVSALSYWELNEVYVLITLTILAIFIPVIYYLFREFQMEVARQTDDCKNPISIYFDKVMQTKCLNKGLQNNKGVLEVQRLDTQFKADMQTIRAEMDRLDMKDLSSNANYDAVLKRLSENEAPELLAEKQKFMDLSGTIAFVKSTYQDNKTNLEKVTKEYKDTFQKSIDIIIETGNSLVNKLYSNIYTKQFESKRKAMVETYNRIKDYLQKMIDMKQVSGEKAKLRDLTPELINGKQ